mgnify:CR=1 FL=1
MRDHWGPTDPVEVDLIEPDDAAFGTASEPAADAPARPHAQPRLQWLAPSLFVLLALAAATATVVAVQPWTPGPTKARFGVAPAEPTLTDRLVAPAAAGSGSYTAAPDRELQVVHGHVFADPRTTTPPEEGFVPRWLTVAAGESRDPGAGEPVEVQGAPGVLGEVGDGFVELTFGPLNGLHYWVSANGLTREEVLRFANSVRVVDGVTEVADVESLQGLQALASTQDYEAAVLSFSTVARQLMPVSTVCYDGAGTWCIVSTPASPEVLKAAAFLMPESTHIVVHGEDALAFGDPAALPAPTTIVAWVEGGRLIALGGSGTIEEARIVAESVRPATDDEWAAVAG